MLMLIYWEEAYRVYRKTQKLVASKETGLEVNADKTKPRYQNAGRSHSIKTDNCSFEGWTVQIFGNNLNKSKFCLGRN